MSVLVTGGAGYIGGHMALGLLDAGETVIVLDNLSTGFAWAVPEGAKLVVGDMGDTDLVARLIDEHAIDAIAHFAAKIVVPDSVRDPLGYYLNNVSNARTLIEAAIKGGVKTFIFSSTAAVYGETGAEPVSEERCACADFALWAVQADGRMDARGHVQSIRFPLRRAALFQCRRRRPQGPPRPVDAQRHPSHQARRPDGARAPSEDRDLRPGLSDPRRHVCARLYPGHRPHRRAFERARLFARRGASVVCNCGYGHGETVKEVIEVVKRVSGIDFPVVVSGRRAGDPAAIVAKADRARSVLGWKPTRDNLDEIVRQALDWERRLHNRRQRDRRPAG